MFEVYFHFAGDMDATIHLFGLHQLQWMPLDDGTYLLAGISRAQGAHDRLRPIPGVTLLPHKRSPQQLGACAAVLKGMKKPPTSASTMSEALQGLNGFFDPET